VRVFSKRYGPHNRLGEPQSKETTHQIRLMSAAATTRGDEFAQRYSPARNGSICANRVDLRSR
jgi:hypothetical protein